ncbi:Inositol polyphosphate kinase family protein [Tritrichomonas foetus]|uniref:Kinase n=1 Tax=Tritrichomonas foetus TaxID=1144522 RepID=A0A1J4J4Z3_9EUKA|nr:Inositol polyphosphate kinase family protein [Tritrichomonas foetus]|eukprot:OHS94384.1 Inositol polyphosphate kinase family protein [Tritrichomonas foetus]
MNFSIVYIFFLIQNNKIASLFFFMTDVAELTLHVDNRPEMELRSKIFGHPGIIVPFKEGLIAKKGALDEELQFYADYSKWVRKIIPRDLVPEVAGISPSISLDCLNSDQKDVVNMKVIRNVANPNHLNKPVLLLRDLASGLERPCVLDVKLGNRTWELGAQDKAKRRMEKCSETAMTLFFRIRAALWHSENPDKWPIQDGINCVTRQFGNNCNREELIDFLRDFLHYPGLVEFFIKKLSKLKKSLLNLRVEADARMFSTSILFVYDDAHPERAECRMLDFAKTYFDIKKKAAQYHERLEDCEDGVIPAITNMLSILEVIKSS